MQIDRATMPPGAKNPTTTLAWLWDVEEKVAALRAGATIDHPAVLQSVPPVGGTAVQPSPPGSGGRGILYTLSRSDKV